MESITPEFIAQGVAWFVAFLFALTVHEAAHAWAAYKLGDPTAYEGGQVTLNPLPHMQREPFGTLLMPVLSYALAGWMMGWASAPYDPVWARRYPQRAALMALAGPASNLLLVGLAAIAIRVGLAQGAFEPGGPGTSMFTQLVVATGGGAAEGLALVLSIVFALNLLLFLFNLIPLPPLDGSAVMGLFLPQRWNDRYQEFLREPGFALLGLLVAWKFFGYVFWPVYMLATVVLFL